MSDITILEEKHMISILMYLLENDNSKKTDVYSNVSYGPRMSAKVDILRSAGLVNLTKQSNMELISLTEKGRNVAESLAVINSRMADA